MAKILLIEDDTLIGEAVVDVLETANHTVEWTQNGKEALERLNLYEYDLGVFDWNVPGMPGIEVCRQYRAKGGAIPIILLTGNSEIGERVDGFDAGADDYLTKPFSLKELVARVRALLRRPPQTASDILEFSGLAIDCKTCKVTRNGIDIPLLPKELALLEFLVRHPEQVFSVQDLLNRIWSSESDSTEDAVRQCITRLRKKIDLEGQPDLIVTVKGLGYKLQLP
ncbi:MAG TPA: response regulator transcription factor [Trichormus sp.]|jgi:DNA-binding response OmpR family regulator